MRIITVKVPEDMVEWADGLARAWGTTRSDIIRRALWLYRMVLEGRVDLARLALRVKLAHGHLQGGPRGDGDGDEGYEGGRVAEDQLEKPVKVVKLLG